MFIIIFVITCFYMYSVLSVSVKPLETNRTCLDCTHNIAALFLRRNCDKQLLISGHVKTSKPEQEVELKVNSLSYRTDVQDLWIVSEIDSK